MYTIQVYITRQEMMVAYIRGHRFLPPSHRASLTSSTDQTPTRRMCPSWPMRSVYRLEAAMAPAAGSEEPYSGEASMAWVCEHDVPKPPYGLWRVMSSGKKRQPVTNALTE